jgi:hypothetical protein
MNVYLYDPKTFVWCGVDVASSNPLDNGSWLVPASATLVKPDMPTSDKLVTVFNPNTNTWNNVEDHRQYMSEEGKLLGGTPYWLSGDSFDSEPRYMKELGPLPAGALLTAPLKTLSQAKTSKIEAINIETSQKITAGFIYKGYEYSYDRDDQQNFSDMAVSAQSKVSSGDISTVAWNSYRPNVTVVVQIFTPLEFLDLYMNGALKHKYSQLDTARNRKEAVRRATTVSEVEQV